MKNSLGAIMSQQIGQKHCQSIYPALEQKQTNEKSGDLGFFQSNTTSQGQIQDDLNSIPKNDRKDIIKQVLENYTSSWTSSKESKNLLLTLQDKSLSMEEKFKGLVDYFENKNNANKKLWHTINNNSIFNEWNSAKMSTSAGTTFFKHQDYLFFCLCIVPIPFFLIAGACLLPSLVRDNLTRKPVVKRKIEGSLNRLNKLNKISLEALFDKIKEKRLNENFHSNASNKFFSTQEFCKDTISAAVKNYLMENREYYDFGTKVFHANKNNGKKLFVTLLELINETYREQLLTPGCTGKSP